MIVKILTAENSGSFFPESQPISILSTGIMSISSKLDISNLIDTKLPDNNSREIDAADVREVLHTIVDNTWSVLEYPSLSASSGESVISESGTNSIYRSNATTPIATTSTDSIVFGNDSIISGDYSVVGGGVCNNIINSNSFVGIHGGCCNSVSGWYNASSNSEYSSILGGGCNKIVYGRYSNILGGEINELISSDCSSIASGYRNCVCSTSYSSIVGGCDNTVSGYDGETTLNSILGGKCNNICSLKDTFVIGSCISADRDCATFVNNISIVDIPTSPSGLPSKSVWYCAANCQLMIVP